MADHDTEPDRYVDASGFVRAGAREMARREQVADEVVAALHRAGLAATVWRMFSPRTPGAVVVVDPDFAPGPSSVHVDWNPSDELVDATVDAMAAGRLDDPAIELSGRIDEAMQAAVLTVLRLAGFDVTPSDEEMTPFQVDVLEVGSRGVPGVTHTTPRDDSCDSDGSC